MKTAVLLLLLIPLFRVSLSSDLLVPKTLIRDQHLGVSIGNFEIHKSHRLFNTSVMGVTSKEDQPTDCAFTCTRLPWCLSYNFQKTADKHGKHLCEALSIDKYNNSKDFQPDEDFDHFSISSPCSEDPCRNGGSCVALYEKNDFNCVCPAELKGRHCEIKLLTSCKEIYDVEKMKGDKAYSLLMNSEEVQVYCHMTDIPGCGGGGWTLVMKLDGSKTTFGFDSPYWSDNKTYNLAGGMTGLDSEETKLPTYWNTPFTKICLGMKVESDTRFILLPKQARSLYSLVADGVHRATSLSRDTWKSLIAGSSLQQNCNKQGFNTAGARVDRSNSRIGFIANNENECVSPNSIIGFGTGNYPYPDNTCGNKAFAGGDNGDKNIKAMGYIFLQ